MSTRGSLSTVSPSNLTTPDFPTSIAISSPPPLTTSNPLTSTSIVLDTSSVTTGAALTNTSLGPTTTAPTISTETSPQAAGPTPPARATSSEQATALLKQGLNPGQKTGIAVGVLLFIFLCGLVAYIFYRRRKHRKGSEGYIMRRKPDTRQQGPPKLPLVAFTDDRISDAWYDQPKDDNAMIRLFREVDGRLTDHVLSFYVVPDGDSYDDELPMIPRNIRRDLESRISSLGHLLLRQESRMFVLRSIIADRIMRTVVEEIKTPGPGATEVPPASKPDREAFASPAPRDRPYHDHDFREEIILRLAQISHDETKAFAISGLAVGARLQSMESVARSAVNFLITMRKQPTRFELCWPLPHPGKPSISVFDHQTMEALYTVPREGNSGYEKVRATVFPGFRKWGDRHMGQEEVALLSKIQVLL